MNTYRKKHLALVLFGVAIAFIYSCSSQKDTLTNRKLQNLSARYNLIYNSNVLLDEYLEGIHQGRKENFDRFLPLYYAPEMASATNAGAKVKELDEIDQKARTIIAEKGLSNYIDDAYILLGKTNFFQGKYYNAKEYFDYVARAYQKDHNIYLNALNWKARSFIELQDLETAEQILDTVKIELDSVKKRKSEPLATIAYFSMIKGRDGEAINYLEQALKAHPSNRNRINWTYTLGQLYENQKEYAKSLAAYHKVEKSNAPFEMYFNAKLSKIRINELLDGKNFNRKQQLLRMLKDDKNVDFVDQIYYEIAEDYYADNDYGMAERNYNLSIRKSTVNSTQKALSYLKIADLNFKHYNNYVRAKLYYDSTVLSLPRNHPMYASISNKAQNLAYLQQRYETIALQDTLQKIAKLPESERHPALSNYFDSRTAASPKANMTSGNVSSGSANVDRPESVAGSTFYFNNASAISRGYNDFKRRWGNRKLANNWRQSNKSGISEQLTDNVSMADNLGVPTSPDHVSANATNAINPSTLYLDSIPLTPAQLEASNQKIIAAYLDMAGFYQQMLKDKPETIKTYELLLSRFPNNGKLDMIYYSLYLAYQGIDNAKSNDYKHLVLDKYPSSVYAKTILDPNFSVKQNQLEATLNRTYEELFDKLQKKDFKAVIAEANNTNQRFPGNSMSAQYDYLKAIAIGRTENVDRLLLAFRDITAQYKADKLIKPLVEQHLLYINAHLNEFKKRKIALISYDPNEIPLTPALATKIRIDEPIIANVLDPTGKKKIERPAPPAPKPAEKVEEKKPVEKPVVKPVKKDSIVVVVPSKKDSIKIVPPVIAKKDTIARAVITKKDTLAKPIAQHIDPVVEKPIVKDDLFNSASSNTYYYVVAVNTLSLSVSSSRFGIGQFNRGNYSGSNLRHQLKELDQDQLIIVGDFNNAGEVQTYQQRIREQLNAIMKVPAANYTTFAISKENLNKITDRKTLERYIRYITSNEL